MSDFRVTLLDILPPVLKRDKTIRAIVESLQATLDRNWGYTDLTLIYKHLDKLPTKILDHMAYMFHVDFYESGLDRGKKIELIRESIKHHMYKGTPWAVENVLSILFKEAWLKEWFEYGGDPYFFRIYTRDGFRNKEESDRFIKTLYAVKNTRSWLEALIFVRDQTIYYGLYGQKFKRIKAFPAKPEDKVEDLPIFFGLKAVRRTVRRVAKMPDVWTTDPLNIFREVTGEGDRLKYGDK